MAALLFFSAFAVRADDVAEVHVVQQTLAGGTTTQLSDQTLLTGTDYSTQSAPSRSGYIFTHWSISGTQPLDNRDRLGRAREVARFHLYEAVTLTANYLPEGEDTDADGIADGWEIYWYGGLAFSPDSDTDADDLTFAEELAAGTDPLMPDASIPGGIVWADGALLQYNPDNLQAYVVRSEPEGVLFATRSDYLSPGQPIPIPSVSGNFAYWTVDGVRQADRLGRAQDTIFVAMPSHAIEIVAVSESDADRRASLYWYGRPDVSAQSDTDADGLTFAEELAAGTDPLMPDASIPGGIVWADGALLQYNPDNLHPYVVRSEPEGVLFATRSDYLSSGAPIPIPSAGGNFAYWTVDGARQADRLGRAKDTLSVAMPSHAIEIVAVSESDADRRASLYWYGRPDMSAQSDTDADGLTFAEELAAGLDPLMPDASIPGGIEWADGALLETDLQPYEQAAGAVVDGAFAPLFASPVSGAPGAVFGDGTPLTPVVWDLNGDGLFDFVVLWKTGFRTYLNVGAPGNPEFEERKDVSTNGVDLAMNDTAKLGVLSLDVTPLDALSATFGDADGDGLDDLLVSDADGRIWYYQGTPGAEGPSAPESLSFVLQHKVWGGSHPGFAEGLRLAAVDWEDDGDLDCLCGTADGKLMLLRDPKVGRPTNVRALVGADNVLLVWDPNAQSRIRGYRVYRSPADAETFARIAQPQLPTHRDFPETVEPYDYRVSSVSRFYTAGNSTPTETESVPTDAVRANLGAVELEWRDAACLGGGEAEVRLAIGNSLHAAAAGASFEVSYDSSLLTPVEVRPSGLTEGATFTADTATPGVWRVTATGGEIAAGSGTLFAFAFRAASVAAETNATVSLASATLRATTGAALDVMAPSAPATVAITPAAGGDDPTVVAPWSLGDVDGNGRLETADLRLLAKYKEGNGRKYGAQALQAGDFNGNGRLDNADYQALRALLKEIEVL